MASVKRADLLLETTEQIVSLAKTKGLIIFYGWADGNNQKTVDWNEEHGGNWEKFLQSAAAVEAKLLYLNWAPFEEFQVDEAIENLEASVQSGTDAGVEPNLLPKRHEIEKYRDKVGLTAVLDLAFIHQDVVHIYQSFAAWFQAFEELTEGLEQESLESGEAFTERVVDKSLVKKWALELANHPKFGTTRSGDQKELLLENIAGLEIDTLPVGHILARADSIYQLEIKPIEDERIRVKVRELRKEGLNISAIAVKLGISKDRVSGLLSG